MSLPAIMKHLKILEEAQLISVEKNGRVKKCHFQPENLTPVTDWVSRYQKHWQDQLQGLEKYLKDMDQ